MSIQVPRDLGEHDWGHRVSELFRQHVTVSDEAIKALLNAWTGYTELKRYDFLDQPGKRETNLYIIASGSFRIYFPNNEEEICVGFGYPGTLICSYPSFISQQPSQYYIQALTRSKLYHIARNDFYGLFDTFPQLERSWRLQEEQALLGKIEREVELLTFTPVERYQRLLERSPHIFQIIPKKYIASYLRMTPETMSRLAFA